MSDPTSSSCGIGTPADQQGACTGTLTPIDAGKGVFDGLSASPVVVGFAGAGALVAGLLFAIFVTRVVGGFFGDKPKSVRRRGKKFSTIVEEHLRDHPETDPFSTVVEDHMREHGSSVARGDAGDLDRYDDDDRELDREDDTEAGQDDADWDSDSPGYRRKFE